MMPKRCKKCGKKFKPIGRYQHFCLDCLKEINLLSYARYLKMLKRNANYGELPPKKQKNVMWNGE